MSRPSAAVAPTAGCVVLFRDPVIGTGGHTGLFVRRTRAGEWMVRMWGSTLSRRLDGRHIQGYWPPGTRKHSANRMIPFKEAKRRAPARAPRA